MLWSKNVSLSLGQRIFLFQYYFFLYTILFGIMFIQSEKHHSKLAEENLNSLMLLFVFASRSPLTTEASVISQTVKPMTFHPCINYSYSIIFLLMHIKFHLKHVKFLCRQQDGNLQHQNVTEEDDHVKSLEKFHCIADIRKQHEPIKDDCFSLTGLSPSVVMLLSKQPWTTVVITQIKIMKLDYCEHASMQTQKHFQTFRVG